MLGTCALEASNRTQTPGNKKAMEGLEKKRTNTVLCFGTGNITQKPYDEEEKVV
jgi:hypothetical protein